MHLYRIISVAVLVTRNNYWINVRKYQALEHFYRSYKLERKNLFLLSFQKPMFCFQQNCFFLEVSASTVYNSGGIYKLKKKNLKKSILSHEM